MYNPISISVNESILESFNIDILPEKNEDSVYTEAVFQNGKAKLKKAEEIMQKIKDELESEIKKQIDGDKSKNEKTVKNSKFDPKRFWKNPLWKEFEDEISKVFNFRSVIINPYIEKYNSKKDQFESNELNAFTYSMDRYIIDGLITDDGLYDKTRSIILEVYISLGIIRTCTAGELIAMLLHEIGHNIDPALVSVSYTGTNILCKYLTNRNPESKKSEKHFFNKFNIHNDSNFIKFFTTLNVVSNSVKIKLKNILRPILSLNPFSKLMDKMDNKKYDKLANKIMNIVSKDKIQFNYQEYTEAFADNFARMYGYGNELSKLLKVTTDDTVNQIHNDPWFKKEYSRREAVVSTVILSPLNGSHKTDIHRIKAMIREYDKDINDPNIPDKVKEYLKEDKKSCEDVLNEYLNNKDEFYKRIYNIINDAIDELDKDYKEKNYNESNTDETIYESKKAYEKLMKAKKSLTSEEYAEVYKKFGYSKECSFAKDKDGYYCFTHRARSKSYPTIDDIPQKSVDFIRSTS